MIEQLFGSKTRVKLLYLFYGNPNRSFFVREITRKVDEQINSVRRELANLLSIGIITSDTSNNKLYYEVNQKYEFYSPLSNMFGSAPTTGESSEDTMGATLESASQKYWTGAGNLELIVYTGVFTRDESAGVDILLVGQANKIAVAKLVEGLEKQEGKELRYTIMATDTAEYRSQIKDRFWSDLEKSKKQVILDKRAFFGKSAKTTKEK
ncbi:MAG: transcriptional regulator [bacterium]